MTDPQIYEMKLSLNVLEHLGINLYSNVPSVLSEAVANAWDADAKNVRILINQSIGRIEIIDDGIGMTRLEVNDRFLVVGFRRRDKMPGTTPGGRSPMGRKGIGKLSLFSVADNVEVQTIKDGESSALCMCLPDIRENIKDGEGTYFPKSLSSVDRVDFKRGTRIILTELRRGRTIRTASALRKRLARRFSVIGQHQGFRVFVDDTEITPADRDYYGKLQYIWTYDDQSGIKKLCTHLSRDPEDRTPSLTGAQVSISGWLGTVKKSSDLKDDESGDNLNRIAVYVRGKMAQEDILDDFSERGVYASYLIGELRIDTFDKDDLEDAATSSRQHLVEDDSRYQNLKEIIGGELKYIQNKWSEWRTDDGAKKAMEIPAVKGWIEALPSSYKGKAKAWVGRINRISSDTANDDRRLIKHAIIAFEFYKANQGLEQIERIDDQNLESVLDMFQDIDGLEVSLYGQIVHQRLSVIRTLQEKVDDNDKEKIIQRFIFKHLWLLDPHWERVDATEVMEKRVGKLFEEADVQLTKEEKAARIDIGYRQTAGKHVIIEMKRPGVQTNLSDLTKQIRKYRSGIMKILDEIGTPHEPFEIVLLLGRPPSEWNDLGGKKLVKMALEPYRARFVLYDELLQNAYQAYSDYQNKRQSVDRLHDIIQAIEDFAPDNA